MVSALEQDQTLVKDGKRTVQIRGMIDLSLYPRQRLKKERSNGTTETVIPVNTFLQDIRHGIGVVSRNVQAEVLATATEHSYRKSEAILEKRISKETIRQQIITRGEKAKTLPSTRTEARVIPEQKLKDAGSQTQTYKNGQGGSIRSALGRLFHWQRLYLLIDGVHVFQKEKGTNGEETRECKVGAILSQQSETISEVATWCTWGRIEAFRTITQTVLLMAATMLNIPIVLVSDGAKWIRNVRKWIPCLNNAIWILDWFHLKDHLMKCLTVLNVEEASETARQLIGLLWNGTSGDVKQRLGEFLQRTDVNGQLHGAARVAIERFFSYLDNQREGIVNYEEYQKNGLFSILSG